MKPFRHSEYHTVRRVYARYKAGSQGMVTDQGCFSYDDLFEAKLPECFILSINDGYGTRSSPKLQKSLILTLL